MGSLLHNHELFKFLTAHQVTGKKDVTLTGMGDSNSLKGRWSIPNNDYKQFLDLLHDYLWIKGGAPINLIERPRKNESKPLTIDIDFHYSNETNKIRKFEKEQISQFTKHIGETIKKFIKTDDYELLRFFVTMRPSPYPEAKNKYVKDGIHILCPDIGLVNDKQKVLRNYILQKNFVKTSFDNTGYINPDDEVYDKAMVGDQGWFPYGESKPSIAPYQLSHVFTYDPVKNIWDEDDINNYSSRQLMELLSIRYNIPDDDNELVDDNKDEYNILLNGASTRSMTYITDIVEKPSILDDLKDFIITPASEEEKNLVKSIVMECLDKKRADSYDSWMRLGWCLHNIEVSDTMFDLWMDFSRYSSKFSSNNIAQLKVDFFHKMNINDGRPKLTERSLHKWAKNDNPEQYKKIVDNHILQYIRQKMEPTNHHIAVLMKKLYKNNYVASINTKNTDWYFYDDQMNTWKHLNQGIQLKKKIPEDVAKYFSLARDNIRNEMGKANDHDKLIEELKKLLKMENNLYSNAFVESTMRMAETVFCDEDFTNKLNKDPYLFACKNGVLQLRVKTEERPQEHVIFRPGIPEDYLNFLAGYNFPDLDPINYLPYDASNPVFAEIYDFFNKIFPNRDLRDYFLRLLASCLEGANKEQQYYTWEGVGGNGKSKIVELMRLTFGDYQTSLQATVLTRKRPESGAANPDIMAIKSKRFIYLQEPDDKEPLNTSLMKQFSGEDIIEARRLYGDQEKFKVTGKLNMMCNSKPIIKTMDRGTWRRIRVIPFVSKFVTEDDPEYISKKPNVFLRDNELDLKLLKWREPFLSLLVHIYETQYLVAGLEPTPAIVKKASDDYKESSDSFAKFQNERMREELGAEIPFKVIDRAYRKWASSLGGTVRALNSNDLLKRVNDEYGEPVDGRYYDRRVFMDDDEVEAYDAGKQTV
uniref:SF3 helicase domain-containing protein n=1 Tax=viral metagenome TaxID=1070528 RepID=A0A6C0D786_9ZZZZ